MSLFLPDISILLINPFFNVFKSDCPTITDFFLIFNESFYSASGLGASVSLGIASSLGTGFGASDFLGPAIFFTGVEFALFIDNYVAMDETIYSNFVFSFVSISAGTPGTSRFLLPVVSIDFLFFIYRVAGGVSFFGITSDNFAFISCVFLNVESTALVIRLLDEPNSFVSSSTKSLLPDLLVGFKKLCAGRA